MTKKKTINIKDHIDDNSIDLSLCDLQDVPVKELASVPKGTNVDLSNNKISVLGNNFAGTLTHLVKLDLSVNQLYELPDNFGLLVNLKHLDLYKNQLETLPSSFANLRSLKWLDLKENPLVPRMAQVVGTCLDQAECMAAARNVVKFLKVLQKEMEKENERKEQERLEKLMIEEKKAQKKEQKQKRKKIRKNAAKAAENDKNESNLNGAAVVEEVETIEPLLISEDNFSTKTSLLGRIGASLSLLFRVIIMTTLLGALALFVISLLDERLYKKCLQYVQSYTKPVIPALPPNVKENFISIYKLIVMLTSNAFSSSIFLLQLCSKTLVSWYQIISTNESIRLYLKTINDFSYIGYIKASELLSLQYQKLVVLIQGYVK